MSTLKVDTINTSDGSGNITFSRPTVLTAGDIVEADIADNAITLAKMAGGTDGQIITYDASGDPVVVGPGTSGQILTSAGAGAPPTFAAAAGGGKIVQVVNVQTGVYATGTTIMAHDDTIPQNTEGVEVMTLAITPTSATNKLKIDVVSHIAHSVSNTYFIGALFQDSIANAIAVIEEYNKDGTAPGTLNFTHFMVAGTTSSTTFKVRQGVVKAGTTAFNGSGGARQFGGNMASSITITEIAV